MIRIEDVTATYRTYIDSGRDKDAWSAHFEIMKNFVNERKNNKLSAEQLTDELLNATWHVVDRTYIETFTASNSIPGGCELVSRRLATQEELEENKANVRQEIMDDVTDIISSSPALTMHSLGSSHSG